MLDGISDDDLTKEMKDLNEKGESEGLTTMERAHLTCLIMALLERRLSAEEFEKVLIIIKDFREDRFLKSLI